MQLDSEERQLRALGAMEALECLFESLPDHCDIPPRHVASLLAVTNDAIRAALPKSPMLVGVNDEA